MTDLIFLLLIFFMITSTMVSPNAIKVLLPQGKQQTSAKPLTRVIIDKNLNYYAAFGNDKELSLTLEELTPFLQSCAEREPEMYQKGNNGNMHHKCTCHTYIFSFLLPIHHCIYNLAMYNVRFSFPVVV